MTRAFFFFFFFFSPQPKQLKLDELEFQKGLFIIVKIKICDWSIFHSTIRDKPFVAHSNSFFDFEKKKLKIKVAIANLK
jgi:hypothetical protein